MVFFSSILKEISQVSSRLKKEKILRDYGIKYPNLIDVLSYTYSKEYMFGVKKIDYNGPYGNENINNLWNLEIKQLLDNLVNRNFSGNLARDKIKETLAKLEKDEADLLIKILNKDLGIGVNAKTINKLFPGSVLETPYMRCSLLSQVKIEDFDWQRGVFSQIKADGMFANFIIEHDWSAKILSRNGTPFPIKEFQSIVYELAKAGECGVCYQGELLVEEDHLTLSRERGNGVLNHVLKGGSFKENQMPVFVVWDKIPLHHFRKGLFPTCYEARFNSLKNLEDAVQVKIIPTKIVHSLEEARNHYQDCLRQGFEGTVIKNPYGPWKNGTSKDQVKMKLEAEVDLVVRGFNEGKGKNSKTFGSLYCESSDGILRVNISGFKDKEREEIFREKEKWIGKIVTVVANNITKNADNTYSLFLPRFVEMRNDKDEADDFKRIQDIFFEKEIF